jgi:hypothetical protein
MASEKAVEHRHDERGRRGDHEPSHHVAASDHGLREEHRRGQGDGQKNGEGEDWARRHSKFTLGLAGVGLLISLVGGWIVWEQKVLQQITIEDARRAERLDKRAWLGVEVWNTVLEEGAPLSLDLHITNSGQTPALDARLRGHIDIMPDPSLCGAGAISAEEYGFVLPPGAKQALRWGHEGPPLSKEHRARLEDGWVLCISVAVTYRDVFNGTHTTEFCQVQRHTKMLRPCGRGNSAD